MVISSRGSNGITEKLNGLGRECCGIAFFLNEFERVSGNNLEFTVTLSFLKKIS